MSKQIKAIRGMNDILPKDSPLWQQVESKLRELGKSYGYSEIRFPVLEKTDLFKRCIGEVTDIVEKEMFTFVDRENDSLSLRPEGTACCVRAGIENSLFYGETPRLWYMGPFYRHERPQKGRYRQFHQFSAEAFGMAGPDIDAELILLSARIFSTLGLADKVTLQLNSLGTSTERQLYRDDLVTYLNKHKDQLDEDSQRRLDSNPLRILDSKNKDTQALLTNAPVLTDYLNDESRDHFETLKDILNASGISYEINPRLVRGLDYYSNTVFEWVTDTLGAQGTVCAGGRYDCLVEQLGGKPTPAVGFSMGLERAILLLQDMEVSASETPDIYFISDSLEAWKKALNLSESIHEALPECRIINHCGGGSFKSQFKKADKSGASLGLIIGEQELANKQITVKHLLEKKEQETIEESVLIAFLKNI